MDKIDITFQEYEDLLERVAWLEALEAAGVDSWDGIGTARAIFSAQNPGA